MTWSAYHANIFENHQLVESCPYTETHFFKMVWLNIWSVKDPIGLSYCHILIEGIFSPEVTMKYDIIIISWRISSTGQKLPPAMSQTDWDCGKVFNMEIWCCHVATPFSMAKSSPCVKASCHMCVTTEGFHNTSHFRGWKKNLHFVVHLHWKLDDSSESLM